MLRLWVKDNITGIVHEYGTSHHDSLVLMEDGSLHYENLQCCAGTRFPEEGYSFCRADGTVPDIVNSDIGEEYLDIGGHNKTKQSQAQWEICITPNTFDTLGRPDKYARCTHCGFVWTDLYSVKNYFKHCPKCGTKMTCPEP